MTRWRRFALLVSGAIASGGCDKSPTAAAPPVAAFDAARLDSGLAILTGVFDLPAIRSLSALGPLFTIPTVGSFASAAATTACRASAAPAAAAASPSAPRAGGLIADSLFRRVFVYDTAARGYRVSADTSGPAGGIRYVLYTVNNYALPAIPLSPDGWLDLTDQSAGAALRLRSQVAAGTAGSADYLVGLSGTQAADTALLSGTVMAGNRTVTFQDSTASAGFQTTIAATAADSADGLHVAMVATRTQFDPFDFSDAVDFSVTNAARTFRLTGGIDTYCLIPSIGLSVALDGAAFATVTNGTTTPNVARVDRKPLTAGEVQAILGLKDVQQRLFAWLSSLHTPAKALLPRN